MAKDMDMVEKTTSILKNAIKELEEVGHRVNTSSSTSTSTSTSTLPAQLHIRKLQVCLSYMIAILFLKNHGS
jgi:hypothetical protein